MLKWNRVILINYRHAELVSASNIYHQTNFNETFDKLQI